MKRAWLIIAVLVVVIIGGLWLAWPQIRLWQVQQALDHAVIPGLKAYLKATTGLEPAVTHQGVKAEGSAYAVGKLSLKLAGDPAVDISVEKLILNQVEMSLTGDLKRCDLALHQMQVQTKGVVAGVRNWEVEGLAITRDGADIRLAREQLQGVTLSAPGLPEPVEVASIEGRDYVLTLDYEQKRYQGGLGRLAAVGHGFQAGAQSMTFAGDFIRFENGSPLFKQGRFTLKDLEVAVKDRPKLTVAEIAAVSSRQAEAAADRVEVKGLALDPQGLPEGDLSKALKDLGYERFLLGLVWDYAYDRAAKKFDLKELALEGEKMGRASLAFNVAELDYDLGLEPLQNLLALGKAKPQRLSLRYDDHSLLQRLIEFGAKEQGQEPAAFRAKLIADLPLLPGVDAPDPALAAFLAKPGSLCLTVTPKQDLTVLDLTRLSQELLPAMLVWKLDNCGR